MKITDKNYTITTIYFDGQFWCALIEQNRDGQNYAGRFKLNGKMVPSSLACVFQENTYLTCSLGRTNCTSSVVDTTCGVQL